MTGAWGAQYKLAPERGPRDHLRRHWGPLGRAPHSVKLGAFPIYDLKYY